MRIDSIEEVAPSSAANCRCLVLLEIPSGDEQIMTTKTDDVGVDNIMTAANAAWESLPSSRRQKAWCPQKRRHISLCRRHNHLSMDEVIESSINGRHTIWCYCCRNTIRLRSKNKCCLLFHFYLPFAKVSSLLLWELYEICSLFELPPPTSVFGAIFPHRHLEIVEDCPLRHKYGVHVVYHDTMYLDISCRQALNQSGDVYSWGRKWMKVN